MAFRPDILAGRAVILVNIEDNIDKQLRGIRTKIRRFANSMSDIGGDLFRGGTVGTIGALFPVKEFIEFQDQLLFIQTKLQATDVEMLALEQTIRDLGKSTSFTSTEVGKAAQKLAQAGFTLSETQETLQAALDLSRGGQVDLSTSTDILANNIRTYNIATADAAKVSSKFITAARLGTLDIVDLNEAIKNSATTFRLLGLDLSTSLALITRLSTASLRGTIAGTSLNRAFQKLASENKKLADVGITLDEEDLKNPLQILTKLETVLKNLNETEGVTFLNKLLGIRGGRGLGGILIQGLGPLDGMIKQIKESTDEARISAEKLDSRLGGVLRRGVSSFQEFLLAAGQTSEGPLSGFGESLRQFFNQLSALSTANPELLQTIFLLPPAILAAGAAFLTFGFILNKVASAITPLISLNGLLFSSLQRIVGGNLEALGRGKSGLKALGALGKGSSLASLGNISSNNKGFLQYLVSVKRTIQSIVKSAGDFVNKNQGSPFGVPPYPFPLYGVRDTTPGPKGIDFKGSIKGKDLILTGRVVGRGSASGPSLLGGPTTKGLGLGGKFVESLRKLFLLVRGGAAKGFLGILSGIVKTFTTLGNILPRVIRAISRFDVIRTLFNSFKQLGTVLRGIGFVLRGVFRFNTLFLLIEALILFGPKIPAIKSFFDKVGQFFKDIASINVGPSIMGIWDALKNIFGGKFDIGVAQLSSHIRMLIDLVSVGLLNAWDKFRLSIDGVVMKIKEIASGIFQVVDAIIQAVATVGGVAVNSIFRGGTSLFGGADGESLFSTQNLENFFNNVLGLIKFIAEKLISFIGIIAKIADLIRVGITAILRALSFLPGGDAAKNELDKLDPNARRRKMLEDSLAAEGLTLKFQQDKLGNLELANVWGLTDEAIAEQKKRIVATRRRMAKIRSQLGQLGFGAGSEFDQAAALDALNKMPGISIGQTPYQGGNSAQRIFDKFWKPALDPFIDIGRNIINTDMGALQEFGGGAANFMSDAAMDKLLRLPYDGRPGMIPDEDIEALLGPGDLGKAAKQLDNVSRALASTVGSFASTRGQLLKLGQKDTLDKERNKILGEIRDNIDEGVFL